MDRGILQIIEGFASESCYDWVRYNHIKTDKGIDLEFTNYKFLKDIYEDMSPIQVARKASQIGFSTMKIIKSLWLAKTRDYNIIYTLPTFADVGQFVPSKVNAMINTNQVFRDWTADKDSVLQKKVGKGFIYYRGTFSKSGEGKQMEGGVGIMFSSDLNIHDECDRSDQIVMEQYESRLEASKYQGKWYFSNPTVPNTLSQKVWEKSDQKHWFIKCQGCNEWQYLDYWVNVKDGEYVCKKCGKIFSDDDRRNGQWVKKFKDREISGYWISHLMCPWISARKIQEEEETKSKQYFYNFVLGLPYIGSDIVVNRDIILRNVDLSEPNFKEHNVLGVDSGLHKYFVLGNKQGIFKVGMVENWSEIEDLIKVYDVEMAVIDALPDLTEPRKLRDKYLGRIWLNYYKKEVKKADYIKWDYKTHTVYSDRSKIIQQVIDDLVNRKIKFQIDVNELSEYIRHWQSLYKITEQDNMGIDRDSWESNGDDHLIHATNYFRIALESSGETNIKEFGLKKKIYTDLAPSIEEELERQEFFKNNQ
jgi:hypothetical protein